MNKRTALWFFVTLALGCGKGTDKMDMDTAPDLTMQPADMRQEAPDLTMAPDLAMAPDMAMGGPMLMNLPSCTDSAVTADMLYTKVFKANCANGNCHATGSGGVTITDGVSLKSAWVGKTFQGASVPVVTAGGGAAAVHKSYLMYKLLGQAATAGGNNTSQMPKNAAPLGTDLLCQFINWIKVGKGE